MPYALVPGMGRERVTASELQALRQDLTRASSRAQARPRQVDHFANTSLDESGPALPPPPRRRRQQHDIQAEREATRQHYEMEQIQVEAANEQKAHERADRKMAQLETWRAGTEQFRRVFKTAVANWVQTGSPAARAFEKHLYTAMIAAEKEKTKCDIATWFPNLPHHITLPLNDLGARLHGEARMMREICKHEERAGGMSSHGRLHPEIATGTCCTKVAVQESGTGAETIRVTEYPNLGTDATHLDSLSRFDNFDNPHYEAKKLDTRLALYRIQAQLQTRKLLLRPDATDNRHDTRSSKTLKIIYLSPSVTLAELDQEFSPYGTITNMEIAQAPAKISISPSPATAVIEFQTKVQAASAHIARRSTTMHGMKIKISHFYSDAIRTVPRNESVDDAMCQWSLDALAYVKDKMDAFNEKQTRTAAEGQLIATVFNEIKAFIREHNFNIITATQIVKDEWDGKVVMNSAPQSTPQLRSTLDALEQKLDFFDEQFGESILGGDWRGNRRSG